jgi:hypothetical protein
MNIKELKTQIEKTIQNEWDKLITDYPKFNINKSYSWIKYWGSGGGSLSTETAIKDAISQSKGETHTLIDAITSDMYYEWGNSAHFYDVISTMIPECKED